MVVQSVYPPSGVMGWTMMWYYLTMANGSLVINNQNAYIAAPQNSYCVNVNTYFNVPMWTFISYRQTRKIFPGALTDKSNILVLN